MAIERKGRAFAGYSESVARKADRIIVRGSRIVSKIIAQAEQALGGRLTRFSEVRVEDTHALSTNVAEQQPTDSLTLTTAGGETVPNKPLCR